jgi:hypothetical protein
MLKIIFPALFLVLFIACKSAEKLVIKGNYDAALDKSIKKISKGKAGNEDRDLLDKSYRLANQRDEERIDFLLAEGKAENWDEVYRSYQRLSSRQEKIQKVLPFSVDGRVVQYEHIDYNRRIAEAKANAADYFYNKGNSQMKLNTKEGYRQAYTNFQKAKNYRAEDYPDIEELLIDAKYLGTSRVLVEIDNPRGFRLPPDFFENMLNFGSAGLNSQWVEYYVKDLDKSVEFDFFAVLLIEGVDITQGEIQTNNYMREKTVEDGFEYMLDRRGNVMKDSLGNDIKVLRYKKLNCVVVETVKSRTATIRGTVEFTAVNPRRILKREPIAGTSVFENVYGSYRGDKEALLPEDRELLRQREIPYPDELSMLYDCTELLRQAYTDILRDNRHVFQ